MPASDHTATRILLVELLRASLHPEQVPVSEVGRLALAAANHIGATIPAEYLAAR